MPIYGPSGNTALGLVSPLTTFSGWADYSDSSTSTLPLFLQNGDWTVLTNDASGPYTNTSKIGQGVTSLWDSVNNRLVFNDLPLGASVVLRVDVDVTGQQNNQVIEMRLVTQDSFESDIFSQGLDKTYLLDGANSPQSLVRTTFFHIGEGFRNSLTEEEYTPRIQMRSDGLALVRINGFFVQYIWNDT